MAIAGVNPPGQAKFIVVSKGYRRRKTTNAFMLVLTGLAMLVALVPLFWIIGYVVYKGGQYITLDLFTQLPKPAGIPGGGVLHAIEGTILLIVLSGVIAIPPGLLAAFYAAYHPNTSLGVALRFGTDVLSGVPSIVIGIFGYALLVKPMGHYSAIAGAFALAILMLPTIIRTTEEMIKLTPKTLREGSLALGAPEWTTALRVTVPAALNGIVTGFILGLARASGETAPLLFTALGNDRFEIGRLVQGGLQSGQPIWKILENIVSQPIDSLPLTLYKYTQQPDVERVNQSWAVAFVLMLIVLLANIGARLWIVNRRSKAKG
ncbi:MAG: phosphate ABC transporter permease PstA [Anaerolineaceae bacterium]|nr:phosphate ABC transporter permease PstA [Anaerolineaceae bacterium]